MSKLLFLSLIIFSYATYGQSYSNGSKFIAYKLTYADKDGNVKASIDLKDVTIEINSSSKLITINGPGNYYEKYFYNEYNKNVVVKGNYFDLFTIYKSYSSESDKPLTDVLVVMKEPKTEQATSLKFFKLTGANQGDLTYYFR